MFNSLPIVRTKSHSKPDVADLRPPHVARSQSGTFAVADSAITAADDSSDSLAAAEQEASLAKEWIAHVDPSSGKTYYAHVHTGETTWTAPAAATVGAVAGTRAGAAQTQSASQRSSTPPRRNP